jgi:hypothetical protein
MNVALNACHFATCCMPVPVPLVKILYACGLKPRLDKREFRSFRPSGANFCRDRCVHCVDVKIGSHSESYSVFLINEYKLVVRES